MCAILTIIYDFMFFTKDTKGQEVANLDINAIYPHMEKLVMNDTPTEG